MPHTNNFHQKDGGDKEDKYAGRLSKRLCYILRYGAIKEGLTVHKEGFVDVNEVLEMNMMRHHTLEEVLQEVDTSLSHRHTKRFESKTFNGKTLIRALFCRNFEPSPYHEGTSVKTFQQICIDYILDNLDDYDLEDFPDEHIISTMISQLKRKKKLNVKVLRQLLVPVLEHLDLDSVYLTQTILKTMWTNCPNLRVLSLKDCGYIVTDSVVETILRKLTKLEALNLAACKHLTDKSVKAMCQFGKNLQQLNLSWIKTISNGAILDLVVNLENLRHLDIYDMQLTGEIRELVIEGARQREIKIVLKGLQESDPDVTIENPSMMLPNFGKTW
ncbi:uncharacterized protein LOC132743408 [Ruditapes philippinarum]|uniref:uncharacterized protein LOC132743408 n=1 Tax=Ruditapes philippinarum TaxID=129788 RepID=UPI00295C3019|nr:uncharacterized protein LOC132743408 [Ruditapes philippinarum]XP_060587913.1 uncharacterized protein LOC132743408 [Ruditapes philippinarum]